MKHIGLIVSSVLSVVANAQSNKPISLQLYLSNNGSVYNGNHTVHISWYTQPVGGLPLFEEQFSVYIEDGITSVELGSTKALPNSVLMNDNVWLGISVNGLDEIIPRTMLVAAPYARVADIALTARALEAGSNGLVTSVNEIAGAVRISADSTLSIQRNGSALLFHSNNPVTEQGMVAGDNSSFEYMVRPSTILTAKSSITLRVQSGSSISAVIAEINPTSNQFIIRTSAILQKNELVLWSLFTP